jgi:hypothetical protein
LKNVALLLRDLLRYWNFMCVKNAAHIEESERLPEGSNLCFCAKLCNIRKAEVRE